MNKIKRLPLFLAVMLCLLSFTAFAQDVENPLDQIGSITIRMNDVDTGKPVPGGSLRVYFVAKPVQDGESIRWEYTDDFSGCRIPIKNIDSPSLAEDLKDYALSWSVPGTDYAIGSDAKVVVENIPMGLYLIVQSETAEEYHTIEPFLVSLPELVDGAYVYDVEAKPKMEHSTDQDHPEPTEPTNPPAPPDIPKTGQPWLPVILLGVFGTVLVLCGAVVLIRGKQK